MNKRNGALYAFYDLAVSRISFDYFGFLVLAEFERQYQQKDVLHLIVVPADGDGFHPNLLYDLKQKQWRLRNIVIPGLSFIPKKPNSRFAGRENRLNNFLLMLIIEYSLRTTRLKTLFLDGT